MSGHSELNCLEEISSIRQGRNHVREGLPMNLQGGSAVTPPSRLLPTQTCEGGAMASRFHLPLTG